MSMKNDTIYSVCTCPFTVSALSDFLDTFGRPPQANKEADCLWVGLKIDESRKFLTNVRFQLYSGKFAIVNYWKCRRTNVIVPLGGNKVGLLPLDK